MNLPTGTGLEIMMAFSILLIIFCAAGIYLLLMQMELARTLGFGISNKLEFEEEDDSDSPDEGAEGAQKEKKDEEIAGRMIVTRGRKAVLAIMVGTIVLMSYLIIVRTVVPAFFAWLGMAAFLFVLLNSHIKDELNTPKQNLSDMHDYVHATENQLRDFLKQLLVGLNS